MTANVALTDTFDQWRVKTNEVLAGTQAIGMANILKTTDTTNSTSNTTGSIITAGGIGVAKCVNIGEDLKVWGDVTTVGDTTISGNLTFGDASTDQVTFSADINSSMVPNANLTFNLGNTIMQWANVWVGHAGITQKTDSGKPALSVTSTDTNVIAIDIDASQIDADVIDIAADAVTTAKVIDISADSLTTGRAISVDDDSASTSSREIVKIIQNNPLAIAATALTLQSDGGVTGMFLDKNFSNVNAATVTGLKLDFDRSVPGSGTATFTDIGIDLDVNAAGLGTTTTTGLDVDVVGATSGTHTATGINIAVGSADTNYALITSGGNVGISTAAPAYGLEVTGTVGITGATTMIGALTVGSDGTDHDVTFYGDTSGRNFTWNAGEDAVKLEDNVKLKVGTGADLAIYHDGSNSYIAEEGTGGLYISTTTSAAPISIGHTTSETTINDNLTVTGTTTLTGGALAPVAITQTATSGSALTVTRDLAAASTDAMLVKIVNDHASDDQQTLWIQQDAAASGVYIDHNGAGIGLNIEHTGATYQGILCYSNQGGDQAASLVEIVADNTAMDNTALHVKNDGTGVHAWGIRCPDGGVAISTEGTNFASMSTGGLTAISQIQGLASDAAISIARHANSGSGPYLIFSKSRGTALGAVTSVADNDECGTIRFAGADGTDNNSIVAQIQARINGTPGSNDMPGELVFSTTADGAASYTDRMWISAAGYVGITTAAPTTALHVTGVITETSMRKTKTNISNMNNMLPSVLQMQGVKFDFKDKKQGQYKDNYGFIAEDTAKVLPHVVSYNKEGKPEGIQYTKMTAVLLEAIKEQQVQIDELKAKLN